IRLPLCPSVSDRRTVSAADFSRTVMCYPFDRKHGRHQTAKRRAVRHDLCGAATAPAILWSIAKLRVRMRRSSIAGLLALPGTHVRALRVLDQKDGSHALAADQPSISGEFLELQAGAR